MPISEAEHRRRVVQALRNARRVYRSADSAGEELERWLDRMINRKTRVTCGQMQPVIPRWEDYRNKVVSVERALIDAMKISCL